ncbi:cation diffusion facilitator family transporter [Ferroacidibacillus organovorans]|uniref:Uncharacterized protein n=1 Tax=Ferroacidibacillus organovorans TaxID=1765683 RepID=A0A101XNS8_9BACL|nr:cation diffusion facilitator family transporter [Ferroacidibacillus organovorans]KUO94832.1 hypothetical protein ATW55_10510 [Ferroacidibacillus organovorans]
MDKPAQRQAYLSLLINIVLTLVKAFFGFVAHSEALIADAAHSASDVAGSIAVLIGVQVARRPADEDHPYGHGKAEVIAASLVAILLILAGLEVVYSSVRTFFLPLSAPSAVALYVALAAALVKEVLYRVQMKLGKRDHSPALIAGAKDHRADVWSSLFAALGIAVALFGEWLHHPLLELADPIAGLFVALVVVRMGYQLAAESYKLLLDEVLDERATEGMIASARDVDGVLRVDDLRVRKSGPYGIAEVRISVDPTISVLQGHAIGHRVKDRLLERHEELRDVLIHINPYNERPPH